MTDYPTVPGPASNLPDGHFTVKKSYRGEVDPGIPASASEIGNQPNDKKIITIEGEEMMDQKSSL